MLRRAFAAGLAAVLWCSAALAAPPSLKIDPNVEPTGQFLILTPDTDAVSVVYIGLDGADPFPSTELKDPRKFILSTRGLAAGRYRFAAVAAGKDGLQVRVDFTVVIGDETIPEPKPKPKPKPDDVQKDPRYQDVKKAYDADTSTTKKQDMAALARLYRDFAAKMTGATPPKLVGDLLALPVARKHAIGERLEGVRLVFEDETATLMLPESTDEKLTAEHRTAFANLLARFANLFEEAAK